MVSTFFTVMTRLLCYPNMNNVDYAPTCIAVHGSDSKRTAVVAGAWRTKLSVRRWGSTARCLAGPIVPMKGAVPGAATMNREHDGEERVEVIRSDS